MRTQLLHRNVQRFRVGLVFKAHRLCVSLKSGLQCNKEEDAPVHGAERPRILSHRHHLAQRLSSDCVDPAPADPPISERNVSLCRTKFSIREQLIHRNVLRCRSGLVFKAHRLCVSLNSRLDSNKEEEKILQFQNATFRSVAPNECVGPGETRFGENATVRGRAWYKLLGAPVLTMDVSV